MNFDDEEDIPILLDTSASNDNVGAPGPDVAKQDDIRVPLTIVTGNLKISNLAGSHLIEVRLSWGRKDYIGELYFT